MEKSFRAFRVTETEDGFRRDIVHREIADLPEGEMLINVKYSSINYKDALSSTGNKGVTRHYPHTPGIDAAGIVAASTSEAFSKGDEVIVTGYDLGMNTDGGFGEYIRVPAGWPVKRPDGLTLKESMMYGTAGFTAALSVYKLLQTLKNEDGDILVTGGTGGVATIAAKILVKLGFDVVMATGKVGSQQEALMKLGIKSVVSREDVADPSGKPMLKSRWAGVIDTVGGSTLTSVLKTTHYNGVVTTCGNVGGDKFESSVYPFILRGITLCGIDSVQCPMDMRINIWDALAGPWKPGTLSDMITTISLEELDDRIADMLQGKHVGRIVLKHNG
ncbi:MAG: YhdH/YhfP family quinone oxidoreductase [Bacillota bacterium]|nr:YhdH/YhfP family quinone oxidoreductase [Bacillota bacterium]MDW7677781.1 YhdH/YhfP family quinone oxidoreductase [Bacillota bacterium]